MREGGSRKETVEVEHRSTRSRVAEFERTYISFHVARVLSKMALHKITSNEGPRQGAVKSGRDFSRSESRQFGMSQRPHP